MGEGRYGEPRNAAQAPQTARSASTPRSVGWWFRTSISMFARWSSMGLDGERGLPHGGSISTRRARCSRRTPDASARRTPGRRVVIPFVESCKRVSTLRATPVGLAARGAARGAAQAAVPTRAFEAILDRIDDVFAQISLTISASRTSSRSVTAAMRSPRARRSEIFRWNSDQRRSSRPFDLVKTPRRRSAPARPRSFIARGLDDLDADGQPLVDFFEPVPPS